MISAAADKLYDGTNLYDLRLVSTMGFTRSDVDRLAVVEGVQSVMPAMSMDAMTRMGNLQIATRISSMDVDAVEKGVEQDARSDDALPVFRGADDVGRRGACVFGRGIHSAGDSRAHDGLGKR